MDGPWTWNYKTLFNRSKDRESHTGRRDRKKEEKNESIIITDFFYLKQKRSRLKIDPEQRLSQFVLQMYF